MLTPLPVFGGRFFGLLLVGGVLDSFSWVIFSYYFVFFYIILYVLIGLILSLMGVLENILY